MTGVQTCALPISSEQPPYSIFTRGVETAVLPTARRHGIGVVVWAPLNGGWLTGKYRKGQALPIGSRGEYASDHFQVNAAKYDAAEALLALASQAGMSLTHLALSWVREHPAVTAAIIGPKTPEQLTDLLAGDHVRLGQDVLDAIDAIVPPGTNLSDADAGWTTWELDAARRRRSVAW